MKVDSKFGKSKKINTRTICADIFLMELQLRPRSHDFILLCSKLFVTFCSQQNTHCISD